MASIDEAKVFEYYQKMYNELEIQDGGYYPSKHDVVALSKTAEHFGIIKEEASRIFSEYSAHAAEIEMDSLRKLPEAIRQRTIQKRLRDIVCNNRDLPFFKTEGIPSEGITNPLEVLTEAYRELVETVANAGWTIPLDIDICNFKVMKTKISDENSIDLFFTNYYTNAKVRLLERKIKRKITNSAQRQMFEECMVSYREDRFQVCRAGLISTLEGLISAYNPDPKDVRLMRVCNHQVENAQNNGQDIKALCWLSMYRFVLGCYNKSDFSTDEPDIMNRHWIQHGRTTRTADKVECLQLINAITTVVCIMDADQ
ncbi:MAG: hypothetical protein ACOX6G_10700 [Christensenellales bacterium]|jgi:hypothetical protein